MKNNLASVGAVFVVIAAGVALGMMWGAGLRDDYDVLVTAYAVLARPGVSLVVVVGCVLALFARPARHAVLLLSLIGALQVVVAVSYAVFVWLPHSSFYNRPVG